MLETLQTLDLNLVKNFASFIHQNDLTPYVKFYTKFGNAGRCWIVLCVCLLIVRKTRFLGLAMLCALAATNFFGVEPLKHFFERPRPCTTDLLQFLKCSKSYSFPSGHTAMAFAAFGSAWAMRFEYRWVIFLFATLMGLSRLALFVHYPSDVLAGALLGFTFGGIIGGTFYYLKTRMSHF